ncbi:MAG TPA: hypothetical protein VMW01_07845 [Williamwhitmania sp.]|nr:hypothetical protein [Williamwhitmania sp.]
MKKLVFLSTILMLFIATKMEAGEPAKVSNFTLPYFSVQDADAGADTTTLSVQEIERRADSLTNKVINENRIVGLLDPSKTYTLPIGIQKNIGGTRVTIVLDELRLLPNKAVLKAYMKLEIPESGKSIAFYADEVTIGASGIEAAKLRLMDDKPLPLLGKELTLKKWDTYVEWDCNGYKSTTLAGELTINNNNIHPISTSNQENSTAPLKATVAATFTDVNDILFKLSLGAFKVDGLKDFVFNPGDVYLDMSDTHNPEGINFPAGYTTATMQTPGEYSWRGIYIKNLTVQLPKSFTKNKEATTIAMTNTIIDEDGFTGTLSATNVISKEKGSIGGWAFSVDKITLAIYKNSIDACGLEGIIRPGFINTQEDMKYTAKFDNGNFYLSASLPNKVKFDAFGANVDLANNSTISVEYKDGEYLPKMVLYGSMTMNVGGKLSLGKMDFQQLEISTQAPYIDFRYISVTTGSTNGFPIELKQLAFTSKDSILKMKAVISVNLVKASEGGFAGTGGFTVTTVNSGGKALDYKYKNIHLDTLSVKIKESFFELDGSLVQYQDHPTYGNGFRGEVKATFTPGISGGAVAQFGSVRGMRYWYADAFLKLGHPLVIGTGLGIQAFGGGAYQHMNVLKVADLTAPRDSGATTTTSQDMDRYTSTYVPDSTMGFGIKASVMLVSLPTEKAFNGMVTLETRFTNSGGLDYMGFTGAVNFMKDPGTPATSGTGISANLKLEYFASISTFSGKIDVYANLYNILKGSHENNRAGTALLLFSPQDWYVYIGTPEDRIALTFMGLAQADSYFMVGTLIGDLPPVPDQVKSILGEIDFTQSRNPMLLSKGSGFAFGASFSIDTGERTFAIFYGSFSMGAGFDILLRDYGDAHCAGQSGPIGVDGWYAKGQLYAWLKAEIGVKVKIFRKKKKFQILSIGAAVAFTAQLPNPVYLKGVVGGQYSVLGGMVKGNCHFEVTVGEKCEIVGGSAVADIEVISEITPGTGTDEVNVFTLPQVAFNMPVNKNFQLMDIDDKMKNFRIALDYFRVTNNGQPIQCRENWNDQNDVLALEPFNVLPGKKELKLEAKVHFEVQENGNWKNYLDSAGAVETEGKEAIIKTGEAPDYLPESNVAYEYPTANMLNFYKSEYPQGYVILKQGMPELFKPEAGWKKKARFTSTGGELESDITYSEADKKVYFNLPQLTNQTVYTMDIIKIPANAQNVKADTNLVKVAEVRDNGDTLTTNTLEGNINKASEKKLYSLDFRTSLYNTFADKAKTFVNPSGIRHWVYSTVHSFTFSYNSPEPFDKFENDNVGVSAVLLNTEWYHEVLDTVCYGHYPIKPELTVDWRTITTTGPSSAPVKAVEVTSTPESLSEGDIKTKTFNYSSSITDFYYMVAIFAYKDHVDLVNKAAYYLYKYPNDPLVRALYTSVFYSIYEFHPYYIKLDYKLPGLNTITSSPEIRFDL